MSSDDQSDKECPLCMEAFDIDDINFFPCNCQYQICRFCWHRIRTNENGLCPACRQSYPEDPVNFQPLSSAELQKIKSEKKQKIQRDKNKLIDGRKHLSEFRVLQKNLVYAVGLSQRMADPELLKKPEFFGKFGKIIKVAVGTAQAINNNTPTTHTSYVTYARSEDALRAIQAVNNMVVDGRLLKASLGTTKYCSNFLKGQACYKPECMYLHEVAEDEISFTKEDMHQGKHTEYERRLHEQMNATLGQQNSSNFYQSTGKDKETVRTRTNNRTSEEKKRPVTVGSAENLTKMSQHQKEKKASTAKTGWEEQKVTRGGSETRELRRNESAKAIIAEVKRNSKASVNSVSPPTVSNGEANIGGSNSSNNLDIGTISPVSMSFSVSEQMGVVGGGRPDSNPPAMARSASSPSPPIVSQLSNNTIIPVEAADSNNSLLNSRHKPIDIPQPTNSSTNFFLDHDDDLGFDPFTESAKGLEQMIEEEKHFTPPSNLTNGLSNCLATSNNFFSDNNTSSLFNNHQQQPPPPGLHQAFSAANQSDFNQGCDSGTTSFGSMFGSKMHGGSSGNLSMSDLRESFKAMLPNVNVRFISDSNNENNRQQQQLNHHFGNGTPGGGYFGNIGGNSSTSSLPSLQSGLPRTSTGPNQFRPFPFALDQQQQLQQRHQQLGRHPQHQYMGAAQGYMNNFGGGMPNSNGTYHQHNGSIGGPPPMHYQHSQQQPPPSPYSTSQQQNHFGLHYHHHSQQNHHSQQQQQMGGDGTTPFSQADQQQSGWLPVPPGFPPRTGH